MTTTTKLYPPGTYAEFPPELREELVVQRKTQQVPTAYLRPPHQHERLDTVYYKLVAGKRVMALSALKLLVALGMSVNLMEAAIISCRKPGYVEGSIGEDAVARYNEAGDKNDLATQRDALIGLLKQANGNVRALAETLGCSRVGLYRKLKSLEITEVDLARIRYASKGERG